MPQLRSRLVVGAAALAVAATGVTILMPMGTASAARLEATCANTLDDAKTLQGPRSTPPRTGTRSSSRAPAWSTRRSACLAAAPSAATPRRGTVIKQADGANLPALLASEGWVKNFDTSDDTLRVERLTIDGNRDANTGTVALMLRSWNARIYDIDVYGAPSDGIRISNPSKDGVMLRNTMVNSVISDVYIAGAVEAGLRVVDPGNSVTDWTFQRSWIGFSGTHAIQSDNAAGWTFSDLHLYATPKHAIDAHRCFGTSIHNNYIEDFGAESKANETYYGIRCDLQGEANTTITANRIHKFLPPPNGLQELTKAWKLRAAPPERRRDTAAGPLPADVDFVYLALDGVNYGTGHAAVTGNTILGHGTKRETGLLFTKGDGEGQAMSVVSTANLVDNVGTPRRIGPGVRLRRSY
ncbi:right-handed parallel beta-helix repeat-containing protein [Nonomuraea dietziae]|uniref:right-handed parallel beta-helix repeat-containing protein n=1 Tax=Nonomuraea dietziae TaxID=65515 RepID=UPI0031E0860E